jgi:hypothetical protein
VLTSLDLLFSNAKFKEINKSHLVEQLKAMQKQERQREKEIY